MSGCSDSDYVAVSEQSGIQAGEGGFKVNVRGNTDLKGGVISSTATAEKNQLTTGTLTYSDIENSANYDASQIGLSGGYGGTIGKNQKGKADNVNPVPGTTLPKEGGLSVAPPVALNASDDASSTTRSGISAGTVTITDGAKQQQLTGQTAEETIASLNRDTSDTSGALAPIFDQQKIEAGFEITSQFVNQAGTFVANRAAEADAAKQAAKDPNLSPEQRVQAQQQADKLTAEWGAGGSYRRVLTALTAAAGGNVTSGAGQFAVDATVNYVQGLAVSEVKRLADEMQSESARAGLHAIVGCAGAAASSQSCGAGAMGAAASSMLGSLLGPTTGLSGQEKEAQTNWVTSLVVAVAGMAGNGAATAGNAAGTEGRYNRQLHPEEKKVIAEKAGSDKAEQEKLTKAACLAVKCWAEYPVGSDEYNKNYVGQLEASQLQPEIDWVNRQKEAGLFDYTAFQKVGDAVKSDPVGVTKDAAKVVVGGVTAKTGVGLCTTGLGCAVGTWMTAFGLSDAIEGGSGLYNRYNGINLPGENPLRWGFNQLNPKWGDTAYDGLNLTASVLALRAQVPLKMGVADGLNRPNSMFGVTVPRINNATLFPFTNQALPYGTTQGILLYGVGSKGVTVINDVRGAGEKK